MTEQLWCSSILLPSCSGHHRGGQSNSSPAACREPPLPLLKHPEASDSPSAPGVGQIPPCSPGKPSVPRPGCRQEEPIPWGKPGAPGCCGQRPWCRAPSPAQRQARCPSPSTGHSSPLFPGMQQGVKHMASRWVCFSCSLTCSVLLEADPAMEKPGLVQKHKQASPLKPV